MKKIMLSLVMMFMLMTFVTSNAQEPNNEFHLKGISFGIEGSSTGNMIDMDSGENVYFSGFVIGLDYNWLHLDYNNNLNINTYKHEAFDTYHSIRTGGNIGININILNNSNASGGFIIITPKIGYVQIETIVDDYILSKKYKSNIGINFTFGDSNTYYTTIGMGTVQNFHIGIGFFLFDK